MGHVIPLLVMGLSLGGFGVWMFCRAADPEATLARWQKRTGLDYVGPARDACLQKIERSYRSAGVFLMVFAILAFGMAVLSIGAPTRAEIQHREEARRAEEMRRWGKEIEQRILEDAKDPWRVIPAESTQPQKVQPETGPTTAPH